LRNFALTQAILQHHWCCQCIFNWREKRKTWAWASSSCHSLT